MPRNMKIFVTGSVGFIGSALTLRLLERGDDVVAVLPGVGFEPVALVAVVGHRHAAAGAHRHQAGLQVAPLQRGFLQAVFHLQRGQFTLAALGVKAFGLQARADGVAHHFAVAQIRGPRLGELQPLRRRRLASRAGRLARRGRQPLQPPHHGHDRDGAASCAQAEA